MEGTGIVSVAEIRLFDDRLTDVNDRAYLNSRCSGGCCGDQGSYKAGAAQKFGLSAYVDRQDGDRLRYGSSFSDPEGYGPLDLKEASRRLIDEPEFEGRGETIRAAMEAYRPLVERINDYLAEEAGAVLTYSDLKIQEMRPTYIVTGDGRIAKVLGLYNTETRELSLSSDLRGKEVSEVLEHELLHYVQDKFGLIAEYVNEDPMGAREKIENDVEERQDYINRKYPVAMPSRLDHSSRFRQAA